MYQSFADRLDADAPGARSPSAPLRHEATITWSLGRDRILLREIGRSLLFGLLVWLKALANLLTGKRGPAIWLGPIAPPIAARLRSAIAWGGMRLAASPDEADLACRFGPTRAGRSPINARLDTSRSHVARTFHRAFGYPLLIDARSYVGWAVEKSEADGLRDGRIVPCPLNPRPGKSYQKLIDTTADGVVTDLRTHCIGGRPVAVWVETRPARDRLASDAAIRTECVAPAAIFDDEEMLAIEQFVRLIGLDWGTLDILRCRADRRLYIVDVDKTDVGPIAALPVSGKLRSTQLLADLLATAAARPGVRIPETARIRRASA